MPSVSLGLPVYNGAKFLATTLDSLLAQTYEDLEIFISDNGSTDETQQICETYAGRDPRIRYQRVEENRGASWNYANVVRQTTGEFFKWATHDDLLAANYVERCVEVLRAAPEDVILVYPRTMIIDDQGDVVREYHDNLDIRDVTPHARLGRLVRNIVMSNASFGLLRRAPLSKSRLLDTFPSSDYVMMAEFSMLGQFWEIPEPLFFRREHAGMSRVAQRSPSAAADWFLPGSGASGGRRVNESWRLFVEHLRSIRSMPLDRVERARCYEVFLRAWTRRHGPRMVTEPFGIEYTRGWKPLRRHATTP